MRIVCTIYITERRVQPGAGSQRGCQNDQGDDGLRIVPESTIKTLACLDSKAQAEILLSSGGYIYRRRVNIKA